eukprot:TRINITY_DN71973_c0_g1_i1.p1 TRINITY_DN71973_c0_g1~~TRINITY_DN71973_c0_g1_i1.p1  ORF type:complete len:105 (+),score=4.75 TRINITY_DN71973_c0_g1_i1:399-713(+)
MMNSSYILHSSFYMAKLTAVPLKIEPDNNSASKIGCRRRHSSKTQTNPTPVLSSNLFTLPTFTTSQVHQLCPWLMRFSLCTEPSNESNAPKDQTQRVGKDTEER